MTKNPEKIFSIEIWRYIFSFIKDTESYLNTRVTCKLFYDILHNIHIYDKNKLLYIYKFNKNFIPQELCTIYNSTNHCIGNIVFDINGYTRIIDNTKIIVYSSNVFYRYYKLGIYFSRIYNIITENKIEDKIQGFCSIS